MSDKTPDERSILDDAKDEIVGIAKGGVKHPGTKPLLTGAAIGAVAGAVLPVVTWPVGLAVGAGLAIYSRVKK